MRNLFTYFDEAQQKILAQDSAKSQISIADVMTLINNLNELSGILSIRSCNISIDESYLNQFLITFRYFISPSILFKKLVLRYFNFLVN